MNIENDKKCTGNKKKTSKIDIFKNKNVFSYLLFAIFRDFFPAIFIIIAETVYKSEHLRCRRRALTCYSIDYFLF